MRCAVKLRWLLPLLLIVSAHATTHAAATCNTSDVQAAINLSVDGDTVTIPTGTCTWTAGVTIASKGISIIGSGASSTTIIDNATSGGPPNLFKFTPSATSSLSRISGITFSPQAGLSANSLAAPLAFQGTCNSSTCPNIRVDNLVFPGTPSWDGLTQPSATMIVTDNVFGVIDHNTAVETNATGFYEFVNFNNSAWGGVGQYGDNSWAVGDTFGTAQALYVESNTFTETGTGLFPITESEGGFGITAEGGGRVVCRFNTAVGLRSMCVNHGTESNGRPRGGRQMEFYDNSMSCPNNTYPGCWNNAMLLGAGPRSGSLLSLSNSYTWGVGTGINQFVGITEYRALQSIGTFGPCDGSGQWDWNVGTTYYSGTISNVSGSNPYTITVSGSPGWTTNQWVSNGSPYSIHDVTINNGSEITASGANTLTVSAWTSIPYANGDSIQILRATACLDQSSRIGGSLLSGNPPTPTNTSGGWQNQTLDPVYEAGDTSSGSPVFGFVTSNTQHIIANRDYYAEVSQTAQTSSTSPFNGTVGTGYGTLANRPTTCTTGVGYWATDQGSWNQSGSGGQGQLFVCSATNTWTVHYTPYTYPHPLVSPPPPASGFPWGSDCSQGCGIGNDISIPSIQCYVLNNNNPNDTSVPCQTTLAAYGTVPSTADPTQLVFKFTTTHSSYGAVYGGGFGVTNVQWDDTTVGTSHTVIVNYLVPGGGNSYGPYYFFYVAACQHSFPCSQADTTWSSYPGPTGATQGHWFKIVPPLSLPYLPATWKMAELGHMHATQGHPAFLPIISLLGEGQFPNTLPSTATTNNVALKGASPGGGSWFYWNSSSWVGATPQWYATTLTIFDGTNTYICHPDAQGNHTYTANVLTVENTCKTSGGTDSGIALVPFYTGAFGSQSQDNRDYYFDSSTGQYYTLVSQTTAPPANPTSNMTLEVFPSPTAITGNLTANVTFTLYTGATGAHTPAVPSTTVTLSLPVTVEAPTVLAPDPPHSFVGDPNILTYERWAAKSVNNQCSNAGQAYSIPYWIQGHNTWLWVPISAGDFNEIYYWNYDNARVYQSAQEQFLLQMSGSTWGDWAATTTFGSTIANLIIVPTVNNTGGFAYMATNSATSGGSEPNWNTHTSPGATFTDGGITWQVLGNQAYFEGCNRAANDPYVNAVVLSGANLTSEFSQFAGSSLRNVYQTGDARAQNGSYVTGLYGRTVTDLGCVSGGAECAPDNGGIGLPSPFNVVATGTGRGNAYPGMSLASRWRYEYYKGTESNFTSDASLRRKWQYIQNALIDFIDFTSHQSNQGTTDPLSNWYVPADSFQYGLAAEALIEMYNTQQARDPLNTNGFADERIPAAVRKISDYTYQNWFDLPFAAASIHTYSIGFTPHDLQTVVGAGGVGGTANAFYNELEGPVYPMMAWTYAFCGNSCNLPDATSYATFAQNMSYGALAAYDCPSSTGYEWKCQQFGDSQWLHGYQGATGTPKLFGQSFKWALGNYLQWITGNRTYLSDDLNPIRNPCADAPTSATPCAVAHYVPFADTVAGYPVQVNSIQSGTSRFSGTPYEQIDPSNCINGTGHCKFSGDRASPLFNITSNSMQITFFTYETLDPSGTYINYGPNTSCAAGRITTEDSGFPLAVHLTSIPLIQHQFTIPGLTPVTDTWTQIHTLDMAGNVSQNNCGVTSGNFVGGNINATTLSGPSGPVLTPTTLPNGQQGVAYSQAITVSGGVSPYTFSISAGTLPPGLTPTQSGATYTIAGTPTTVGNYSFTVKVVDSNSPPQSAQQAYPVTITPSTALSITTVVLPPATYNVPYNAGLAAIGGVPPYTWSELGVLPQGIHFDTSTGLLTGTPISCSTFPITWTVTDQQSTHASKPIPITVSGCSSNLQVTTTTLADGLQNSSYNCGLCLQASGGQPPYTWSIINGALPDGLVLNPNSGQITGIPTGFGVSNFTVQAQDAVGTRASAPLSITVTISLRITPIVLPNGTEGVPYSAAMAATGGAPPYTWCVEEPVTTPAPPLCDTGTGGALPPGLSMSSAGVFSGIPQAGSAGTYPFTVDVIDSQTNRTVAPEQIVVNTSTPNSVTIKGTVTITGTVVIQ